MRLLLIFLFGLLALPAFAQGWSQYENSRFGFSLAVPPGFEPLPESANGDGQAFAPEGKPVLLDVWGGWLMDDFDSEVTQRMGFDEMDGWTLTEQTVTSRWANYTAVMGSRVLQQRLIALCDGQSYAMFRAEYSTSDTAMMEPILAQLEPSLRASGC